MPVFKTIDAFINAIASNEFQEVTYAGQCPLFGKIPLLTREQQQTLAEAITQNTSLTSLEIRNLRIVDYNFGRHQYDLINAIGRALGANDMPLTSLTLNDCDLVVTDIFCNGLRQNRTITSLQLRHSAAIIYGINELISALDPSKPTDFGVNTTLKKLDIGTTHPSGREGAEIYASMLGQSESLEEINFRTWPGSGEPGYELEHIFRVKKLCRKLPGMEDTLVRHFTLHWTEAYTPLENKVTAFIEKKDFFAIVPLNKGRLHFIAPNKEKADELRALLETLEGQEIQPISLKIKQLNNRHLTIKASDSKLTSLLEAMEQKIELLHSGRLVKSAGKDAEYVPLNRSDDSQSIADGPPL